VKNRRHRANQEVLFAPAARIAVGSRAKPEVMASVHISRVIGFQIEDLAGATGLEPAASCVTGRRSNQLNYAPANESLATCNVFCRLSVLYSVLHVIL
jgi:hypothetical protein